MFRTNAYNLKMHARKFVFFLTMLNIFVFFYLFKTGFSADKMGNSLYFPIFFFAMWVYAYLSYIKMQKISNEEELRQLLLKRKTNKRDSSRCNLNKKNQLRVSFNVISSKFFEYKKKKNGKIINISERGVLIHVDGSSIEKGGRAMNVRIQFPNGKTILEDGVVVRSGADLCALMFIKNYKQNRKTISEFIFNQQMEEAKKQAEEEEGDI